jgi:hypothetical protein
MGPFSLAGKGRATASQSKAPIINAAETIATS